MLYNRFEEKRKRDDTAEDYNAIQKYLLNDETLANSKKPILWIHVPREYNSRNWASFGSRSSLELNQPYLLLTAKSILTKCSESFTICIIDDDTFQKLLPSWEINMNRISTPISGNVRKFGMMQLLYKYGGLVCPLSFLCMKDLIGLYEKGIRGDKPFLCEMTNRNVTHTSFDYYPDISFSGAPREHPTVQKMIDFWQRTMSFDHTAESDFLGNINRWCNSRIQSGEINKINGVDIGTKTIDETPIILDDLMSNNYLNLYTEAYGIYIPADELLKRNKYEWFVRSSTKQVLESNTIIGNYILINLGEIANVIESDAPERNVGFWKVPSDAPYYGLKPNFLGDNVKLLKK
jgi:hypothetical protein